MQVTLKRADFYAKAAQKAADDISYEPNLKLSIYAASLATDAPPSAVKTEVDTAREKLIAQHDLSIALVRANYAIRALLAEANMRHGVHTRETERRQLEAEEKRVRAILKAIDGAADGETTPQAILARAKAAREKPSERSLYRSDDSVTATVFTESDAETLRKQLKRLADVRGGLSDALTALNVSNKITLDAATVATLRKADILPAE